MSQSFREVMLCITIRKLMEGCLWKYSHCGVCKRKQYTSWLDGVTPFFGGLHLVPVGDKCVIKDHHTADVWGICVADKVQSILPAPAVPTHQSFAVAGKWLHKNIEIVKMAAKTKCTAKSFVSFFYNELLTEFYWTLLDMYYHSLSSELHIKPPASVCIKVQS